MDTGVWIAIYLPIIIIIFIVYPSDMKKIKLVRLIKKKRGVKVMSNELIDRLVGKEVLITTGSLGSSYNKVVVVEVVENWIKVEKKGKMDLINIDFVQGIKVL